MTDKEQMKAAVAAVEREAINAYKLKLQAAEPVEQKSPRLSLKKVSKAPAPASKAGESKAAPAFASFKLKKASKPEGVDKPTAASSAEPEARSRLNALKPRTPSKAYPSIDPTPETVKLKPAAKQHTVHNPTANTAKDTVASFKLKPASARSTPPKSTPVEPVADNMRSRLNALKPQTRTRRVTPPTISTAPEKVKLKSVPKAAPAKPADNAQARIAAFSTLKQRLQSPSIKQRYKDQTQKATRPGQVRQHLLHWNAFAPIDYHKLGQRWQ